MFCRHDWELISDTITKSELELVIAAGATSIKNASNKRISIQIVGCKKCGKLKRFVEDIN